MKYTKDLNNIIVYIYDKKYLINDMNKLLEYTFNILKEYYNYTLDNSYKINIYINKIYGIIIELKEDYYTNIKVLKDVLFLYEIDDPLEYLNEEIYYYEDKYYINLKKEDISIIENSNIIYGNDVYKIIGKGIKI